MHLVARDETTTLEFNCIPSDAHMFAGHDTTRLNSIAFQATCSYITVAGASPYRARVLNVAFSTRCLIRHSLSPKMWEIAVAITFARLHKEDASASSAVFGRGSLVGLYTFNVSQVVQFLELMVFFLETCLGASCCLSWVSGVS